MGKYILIRAAQAALALFLLVTIVFVLVRLGPGDPLDQIVGPTASEEVVERVRAELGLDKPLIVQYGIYWLRAAQGDFGDSLRERKPVIEVIGERLPRSAQVAVPGFILGSAVAIILGAIASVKRGTVFDVIVRMMAVLGQSLPSFWLALILIEIFSVRLGILPVAGWETPANYVLPVGVTSVFVLATITRLLRTSMLEVLDSEYIKMARAKGVPENAVIVKHVMRNALIPVVTFGLMYISIIIGNMIIVEIVFCLARFRADDVPLSLVSRLPSDTEWGAYSRDNGSIGKPVGRPSLRRD